MEPSNSSHNPRDLLLYSTSTASRSSSASIGHYSRDTEELFHPPKPSSRVNLSRSRPRRRPSQPADCHTTPKPSHPRHHASGTDKKLSSRNSGFLQMPSFLRLSRWFLPLLDSSGLRSSMSALRIPRLVVGRRRSFLESVSRLDFALARLGHGTLTCGNWV